MAVQALLDGPLVLVIGPRLSGKTTCLNLLHALDSVPPMQRCGGLQEIVDMIKYRDSKCVEQRTCFLVDEYSGANTTLIEEFLKCLPSANATVFLTGQVLNTFHDAIVHAASVVIAFKDPLLGNADKLCREMTPSVTPYSVRELWKNHRAVILNRVTGVADPWNSWTLDPVVPHGESLRTERL